MAQLLDITRKVLLCPCSRRENLFTKQFPHIAQACEGLPPGTLVDGEVVALDANGRISFNLLQYHRSKAQALLFYVFDVLVYRVAVACCKSRWNAGGSC
jgi:ATP-dependent DNA ligase